MGVNIRADPAHDVELFVPSVATRTEAAVDVHVALVVAEVEAGIVAPVLPLPDASVQAAVGTKQAIFLRNDVDDRPPCPPPRTQRPAGG